MTVKQRWLGIAGIAFVALLVASVFAVPNTPDAHASLTKVVSYYHKHKTGMRVSSFIVEVAVFVGVGFFWYLREHLTELNPANKRLATLGFAGSLIFAVSGAVAAGLSWALGDAVDHIAPSAVQTLNVFDSDVNGFLGAPGIALFLAATGVAIIVNRSLPVWLGWAGVVLAIVALVVGFFGLLGIALWILVASIVILVRANSAAPAPA